MLLPTVPRVLEYAWRRHVQVAARRRMVRDAMASDGQPAVCVGFADLVGFTALSQQLDDSELAAVVDRFEATAYDIVGGRGGRVVKMIGDEVMFEVADPAAGVEIALDLADAYHGDESVSDVRVGVAYGPVLAREGDLYGPTVNLASRMVSHRLRRVGRGVGRRPRGARRRRALRVEVAAHPLPQAHRPGAALRRAAGRRHHRGHRRAGPAPPGARPRCADRRCSSSSRLGGGGGRRRRATQERVERRP